MKHTMKLFKIGLIQMSKDGMLLVLAPAPFLLGIFCKLAIPFMNNILTNKWSFSITPWYGLVDGMLICLTPMFVAMISAFILLEERDEGISGFYQITPAQGYSYLFARIGMPMIWAFITTVIAAVAFNISSLSFGVIFLSALISSFAGVFLAMMVVSIAGNRVEGLALSKLMGISLIGLILIWFVPPPYYFAMAFLPSFWIGKLVKEGVNTGSFILGFMSCFLWIVVFTRKFLRRL